jgi:hypothetical protein
VFADGGDPHFIITGLYPPTFVATAARAKVSSHQQSMQGVVVFAMAVVVFFCLVFWCCIFGGGGALLQG